MAGGVGVGLGAATAVDATDSVQSTSLCGDDTEVTTGENETDGNETDGNVTVGNDTEAANETEAEDEPEAENETEEENETEVEAEVELEQAINVSQLNVTALEAAQIAQNETGAKPVAVKLALGNETAVYGVLVVNDTGNVSGVVVNSEGEVVRTVDNLGTVNTTLLQDQGGVADVADLRSAIEAVQAAQGVAPENATAIEVAIETEEGLLLQQVTFAEPAGERNRLTRVLVDATVGPVVGVIHADDEMEDDDVEDETEDADENETEDEEENETEDEEENETEDETVTADATEANETKANETETVTAENESQDDGDANDCPENMEDETSTEGSHTTSQEEAEEDNGLFGDDVFAEDDEFDANDDVGLFVFDGEAFGEQEAGTDFGAQGVEPDENDGGLLDEDEEEGLEGDEEEEENEFGDDDFGF